MQTQVKRMFLNLILSLSALSFIFSAMAQTIFAFSGSLPDKEIDGVMVSLLCPLWAGVYLLAELVRKGGGVNGEGSEHDAVAEARENG